MKIRIRVSRKDIDHGARKECKRCPVARAITRRLKPMTLAHVGTATFSLQTVAVGRGFRHLHRGALPYSVMSFIHDYDEGRPVNPFTFDLCIPARLLKR